MFRPTIILIVLALSVPSQEQDVPLSPCPSVFKYEQPGSEQGRWDGILHLSTDVPLHSIFLNIILNNKAELLGNWIGETTTHDNQEFRIETTETIIMPGKPLEVKFYVKFNTLGNTPLLQKIKLNGKEICNADIFIGGPIPAHPVTTKPVKIEAPATPSTYTNKPPISQIPEGSLITNQIKGDKNIPTLESPVFDKGPNKAIPARIDGEASEINANTPELSSPTTTKQNQCGSVFSGTSLIREGTPTLEGDWPWQVALYHTQLTDNKFICGGTLVSHLHIITAAHCVTLRESRRIGNIATFNVFLGKHNLMTSIRGVEFRYLSNIVIHDDYEPSAFLRDIAILTMQGSVAYSSWIQPACLWPENMVHLNTVIGKIGTVVGWGNNGNTDTNSALTKVGMPVVDPFVCLQSFPTFFERFISEYTYCAGFANGSSACNGDSGGGMVFKMGGSWYLRGLVSLSVKIQEQQTCDPSHYIVFTDVAKFLPWIKSIVTNY